MKHYARTLQGHEKTTRILQKMLGGLRDCSTTETRSNLLALKLWFHELGKRVVGSETKTNRFSLFVKCGKMDVSTKKIFRVVFIYYPEHSQYHLPYC